MVNKMPAVRLITFLALLGLTVYYFYPEETLPRGIQVDKIVVYKSKRQLLAFSKEQLVKTYKISLGKKPVGDKEFEGDKKTPEGIYTINDKTLIVVTIKT
jgi:L,D-transpeptidase catalytic domain